MDLDVGYLPNVYQRALDLQAAGLDPAGIARGLDVDPAAIANLLRLAGAKAARARGGEPTADVQLHPRFASDGTSCAID